MNTGPIVLAGGGHSHALLLRRWAMQPKLRPKRLITLVSRASTTFYSGMMPGVIAGLYSQDQSEIDIRQLCNEAKVSFIKAEITGIDLNRQQLSLLRRPAIRYGILSLNVGGITNQTAKGIGIKPFESSLKIIKQNEGKIQRPIRVIGGGPAGLEIAFALRARYPQQHIQLQVRSTTTIQSSILKTLKKAKIELLHESSDTKALCLLCTGTRGPSWIENGSLPVNAEGRVLTNQKLQVLGHPNVFASGDCGVIKNAERPPGGVWAVRSAQTLAQNLAAYSKGATLRHWTPQRHAIELIGDQQGRAWLRWRNRTWGPSIMIWTIKSWIDRRFRDKFNQQTKMNEGTPMDCQGCAAKLPALPLETALEDAGMDTTAEDAAIVSSDGKSSIIQSVDGFPALINDPWLNARITTLHACSDIVACGGHIKNAMAIITVPKMTGNEQAEILSQSIQGIKSALKDYSATLLGGHTIEARTKSPTLHPDAQDIHISLSVNGITTRFWEKRGIQAGDTLLINRPIGTGILFAGFNSGKLNSKEIDNVLHTINTSHRQCLERLEHLNIQVNGCTDITGFGLYGHLSEMVENSRGLAAVLDMSLVPTYPKTYDLLKQGISSTLSPHNKSKLNKPSRRMQFKSPLTHFDKELLSDPQTCGPLLISCSEDHAMKLQKEGKWITIGHIKSLQ